MLDLRRQYARIRAEIAAALEQVCETQHFILGPTVADFERASAEFLGAKAGVGCASGTDALWLALAAAKIGPGMAVVTTPFSFFATASCITRVGATPIFADIDPGTLNLDPAQVERCLRQADQPVRALLPVHLFGQCVDNDAFRRLADGYKLVLIEDAAQAFGASWDGRRAGSLGDAAAFSFYPTKNLSAYGDGGLLTTSDPGLAERAALLRNHGSRDRYYHDEIGWNSRLDALQAAVLRVKLNYIESWNQQRRARAATYGQLLAAAGLLLSSPSPNHPNEPKSGSSGAPTNHPNEPKSGSSGAPTNHPNEPKSGSSGAPTEGECGGPVVGGGSRPLAPGAPLSLLTTATKAYHIFHQYVVRALRRDQLRQFLGQRGVATEVYYPVSLHRQKCFAYLGYREGDLPVSEGAAREVLALPMFPELREDEQQYVVDSIAEFYS
jgi:dTDP-4-amino-4,6-dideoxygalactose transaminase